MSKSNYDKALFKSKGAVMKAQTESQPLLKPLLDLVVLVSDCMATHNQESTTQDSGFWDYFNEAKPYTSNSQVLREASHHYILSQHNITPEVKVLWRYFLTMDKNDRDRAFKEVLEDLQKSDLSSVRRKQLDNLKYGLILAGAEVSKEIEKSAGLRILSDEAGPFIEQMEDLVVHNDSVDTKLGKYLDAIKKIYAHKGENLILHGNDKLIAVTARLSALSNLSSFQNLPEFRGILGEGNNHRIVPLMILGLYLIEVIKEDKELLTQTLPTDGRQYNNLERVVSSYLKERSKEKPDEEKLLQLQEYACILMVAGFQVTNLDLLNELYDAGRQKNGRNDFIARAFSLQKKVIDSFKSVESTVRGWGLQEKLDRIYRGEASEKDKNEFKERVWQAMLQSENLKRTLDIAPGMKDFIMPAIEAAMEQTSSKKRILEENFWRNVALGVTGGICLTFATAAIVGGIVMTVTAGASLGLLMGGIYLAIYGGFFGAIGGIASLWSMKEFPNVEAANDFMQTLLEKVEKILGAPIEKKTVSAEVEPAKGAEESIQEGVEKKAVATTQETKEKDEDTIEKDTVISITKDRKELRVFEQWQEREQNAQQEFRENYRAPAPSTQIRSPDPKEVKGTGKGAERE